MYLCNLFSNILLFTYVKHVENIWVFFVKQTPFKLFYM